MTISEAISLVDKLKPNQYEESLKRGWLSKLDGQIHKEIILTHTHTEEQSTFAGYDADTPGTTALLVPYPYDEDIYNYYLQSMIDRENMEIVKYNQSAAMYNTALDMYRNWYNRTYLPIPARSRFLF